MSWFTVGEIVVWLLVAAVLGFALGWLVRGLLQRPRPVPTPVLVEDEADASAPGTRIADIDTGRSRTDTGAVPVTRFAPPGEEVALEPDPPTSEELVAAIARRTAGGLTPPSDDLVRIHGVGPKIAGLLASMGITSFRQVARLTPEEVVVVDEALGVFPGRIARDDWMGSARELHREVYGSDPAP